MQRSFLKLALILPATLVFSAPGFAAPCSRTADSTSTSASLVDSSAMRGFIGISISQMTPARAQMLNNPVLNSANSNGILIGRVLEASPAAIAGLSAGDVVIGVSGQSVTSIEELQKIIASSPLGTPIPITFQRGSQVKTLLVPVGDADVLKGRM